MTTKLSIVCRDTGSRDQLLECAQSATALQVSAHVGFGFGSLHDLLEAEDPDVVVLDVTENEDAVLRQLREAHDYAAGLPVLLISPDRSAEFLRRAMRAGARDVLAPPLTPASLQLAASYAAAKRDRQKGAPLARQSRPLGQIFAFYPVKGGSGNTFLASNLAHGLSLQGKRVLLIDLNLYFGDAASYLSDKPVTASVVDLLRQTQRLDATLISSSVQKLSAMLHVLAAPALPQRLEDATEAALTTLLSACRASYDCIVLDLDRPPTPLCVTALELSDSIYLTLPPLVPALQDLKRVLEVLGKLDLKDKPEAVLSYVSASNVIAATDIQEFSGVRQVRCMPFSARAGDACNQGIALSSIAPKDPLVLALHGWAEAICNTASPLKAGGWLQNLLRRPSGSAVAAAVRSS